jgi:hypothetical protein
MIFVVTGGPVVQTHLMAVIAATCESTQSCDRWQTLNAGLIRRRAPQLISFEL